MQISILGIDLGRNSCSVVGLDDTGKVIMRRAAHDTVRHSEREYARGPVHANSAEGAPNDLWRLPSHQLAPR
jgi:hypothetical protein